MNSFLIDKGYRKTDSYTCFPIAFNRKNYLTNQIVIYA